MAKIRIVDDDVEFAGNLASILKAAGHDVTHSATTLGLIDDLIRNLPDLLIFDVMFPDNPVAGFDAVRAVRARREIARIPIIMLSAVNDEYPMQFSACDIDPDWLPIQDFVEKHTDSQTILKKVNALLSASATR
jgi:DNA-binding response OmpR family regulator